MPTVTSPYESRSAPASASGAVLLHEKAGQHRELLLGLAGKYIWWLSAEEAMGFPARVIAQVMNLGVFADVGRLAEALGEDCLREVLRHAEAGQFSDRSWHYWHYRLGLATVGQVPPLPTRHIPGTI